MYGVSTLRDRRINWNARLPLAATRHRAGPQHLIIWLSWEAIQTIPRDPYQEILLLTIQIKKSNSLEYHLACLPMYLIRIPPKYSSWGWFTGSYLHLPSKNQVIIYPINRKNKHSIKNLNPWRWEITMVTCTWFCGPTQMSWSEILLQLAERGRLHGRIKA